MRRPWCVWRTAERRETWCSTLTSQYQRADREENMKRREFLKTAGVGATASALAAPAIAQSMPEVKWRLAASWPKSLDTLYGGCEYFAKRIAEVTDNKFQIQVFAAGEIVPGLQVLDAVQNGTVEMGNTALYYYWGKDPAFTFGTALPFGLNARQMNSWLRFGGGADLLNELLKNFNCIGVAAANTGAQMGGWFRKEIKSVADLSGLKFRIGGFGGSIIQRVGVVPQQLAAPDIYPALEKGTLDAAEWVGPYDDEKLGFAKVAKYYYYPGWWEGGPELDLLVNIKAWESLPPEYKAILESACAEANVWMVAKYDALNPDALKRLLASGVKLQPFSNEIMAACYKASAEVYDEFATKNPKFKKVYDSWKKFRNEQNQWFAVAESRFDNFMIAAERLTQRGP